MTQVIGVGFKKGRGKDTVANRLVDKYGFIRLGFADPLKNAAREIFSFSEAQLYGDRKEILDTFWGITPREAMQLLGTDACRNNIRDDIWIKAAHRKILKLPPNSKVVISDVRFANEAEFIKSIGGQLWRIDRELKDTIGSTHPSEIELDSWSDWDEIIDNNGSLSNLYAHIEGIFTKEVSSGESKNKRGKHSVTIR